ncbi:thermonuclease family protein [Vibrio aerogenes]|nr:thermonuclease family protein [Vibrio aerogenes]
MFRAPLIAIFTLFVSMISCHTYAAGKTTYGSAVINKVTSIYDADTFKANIKGWPDIIGKKVSIRVNGVDAPEIRGKCKKEKNSARIAKLFTIKALRTAKKIELRNIRRGKYFRILADVYVDGRNLSDLLINSGLARPYDGGKRGGWCRF